MPGSEVSVSLAEDFVAVVEIQRPPTNYIDAALVATLADTSSPTTTSRTSTAPCSAGPTRRCGAAGARGAALRLPRVVHWELLGLAY